MLLKLGMGSGGTRTVERKNETWQQSRELDIKSLGRLSNDDGDGTTRNGKEQQLCTYITLFFSHFFAVVARLRRETT